MNRLKLIGLLVASLLLGGCADTKGLSGGADAPIEERGAVATAGAAASGAQTKGTGTEVSTAGATATKMGSPTGTGGSGGTGVETQALPMPGGSEARAIEASSVTNAASGRTVADGSSMAGQSTGGPSSVVGVTPGQAALLHDSNNLLSKRVIYFDFDSDAIRDEFRGLIEAHARLLAGTPSARIVLQGHTDERGSRDYNLALGQRRAEGVRQALTLMGVRGEQIETVSLGEEKPAAEGHDEAAWKLNRRAEIHYLGE